MKIAIDIRRARDFGVGTYIRNTIKALARLDSLNEYVLIGANEAWGDLQPLPPSFIHEPYRGGPLKLRNFLDHRAILKRHRADIIHVPHLFWVPRSLPIPYLMTVHDMVDYALRPALPQNKPSAMAAMQHGAQHYFTSRALHNAARVIAVSNSTKQDIMRFFRLHADRIEVIYNAIDERFTLGHASELERTTVAERYQVRHPFLLYVGNIKAHKNIGRIIEAFAALKAQLQKEERFPDLKLIIIGDELSKHPDLRRTVARTRMQTDVRFLGFVPIDELRIFYDMAKVFIFPSLYEGFGLPPLEAMSLGTPVVTSNTTALPEVVGSAAVLVNPENVFEIMRAVHRTLVDQALRERMKAAGYEQAKKFSWERSASQLLEAYRQVNQNELAMIDVR